LSGQGADFTAGCVIAGAGVVGLAVARALACAGHDVLILEAAQNFGQGTSSRSSEVLHAGIYYTPGSLRARFCAQGRRDLTAYADAHSVPWRRCGKLLVATEAAEEPVLEDLARRALINGVEALVPITSTEARALEPELSCTAALHSQATGIIDSHALMFSLLGEAQDGGVGFVPQSPVLRAEVNREGFLVHVGGSEPTRVQCRVLVNAAGLDACALASRIEGLDAAHIPTPYLSKGSYFALRGRNPFTRLIYPAPIPGGAGIHLTLDMAGAARFGPDVEAVTERATHVDPHRAAAFYASIRRYWPGLPDGSLIPAYAGLRPKIVPAEQSQDFVIQDFATHGVPGLVNLFGIESPGLTSCLAIAEHVAGLVA
jgi:L-2-hydroxyglutarate oxidase LhgO